MNKFPELKTLPTHEEINELKQRNAELMAKVEQLREVINHYQEGQVPSDNAMDELIHRANKAPAQCLAEVKAQAVEALRFPTMFRKMWSGGEVQDWLKEEAKLIRQQAKEDL